jgi:hypothetical protein
MFALIPIGMYYVPSPHHLTGEDKSERTEGDAREKGVNGIPGMREGLS